MYVVKTIYRIKFYCS